MCGCVTARLVCRSVRSLSLAVVYLETSSQYWISVNGGNVAEDGWSDYQIVMPKQNTADLRATLKNTCTRKWHICLLLVWLYYFPAHLTFFYLNYQLQLSLFYFCSRYFCRASIFNSMSEKICCFVSVITTPLLSLVCSSWSPWMVFMCLVVAGLSGWSLVFWSPVCVPHCLSR